MVFIVISKKVIFITSYADDICIELKNIFKNHATTTCLVCSLSDDKSVTKNMRVFLRSHCKRFFW